MGNNHAETPLNADTWVVVPMLNEAGSIEAVVGELRAHFANVLCIDDGSSDGSAALARHAGARVVQHAVNLGQGAALQTAFEYLRTVPHARWAITFDSDGQHLVGDAVAMLARARAEDLDVVLASRFLGTSVSMPRVRRAVLLAAVRFTRATTKLAITDAHNGLRVLSRGAFSTIDLRHARMAHASELLHRIASAGLTYAEHPATVVYTAESRAKGQRSINAVNILFDLATARIRPTP